MQSSESKSQDLAVQKDIYDETLDLFAEAELRIFRDRLELPIPDDKLKEYPYYHPGSGSDEVEYMIERRASGSDRVSVGAGSPTAAIQAVEGSRSTAACGRLRGSPTRTEDADARTAGMAERTPNLRAS